MSFESTVSRQVFCKNIHVVSWPNTISHNQALNNTDMIRLIHAICTDLVLVIDTNVNDLDPFVDHALVDYFVKFEKLPSKSKASYRLRDLGTKIIHH